MPDDKYQTVFEARVLHGYRHEAKQNLEDLAWEILTDEATGEEIRGDSYEEVREMVRNSGTEDGPVVIAEIKIKYRTVLEYVIEDADGSFLCKSPGEDDTIIDGPMELKEAEILLCRMCNG